MTVWVIIAAAGRASRFGALKQFERLGGRPIVDWSLDAAQSVADGVVLVVPAGADPPSVVGVDVVVEGGATRSGSVRAGLAAVPASAEVIVVHDAARPLARAAHFEAAVAAVRGGADGAVCAVPVNDTVKRVSAGTVVETLDRSSLWAVQTPQAFRAEALRRAHYSGTEATDDAAVVEAAGGRVVVVAGDARNIKLTTPGDLTVAEALLATLGNVIQTSDGPHVGFGVDIHPVTDDPTRPLVLGGVVFDGGAGLAGHSDADVVAHALADALLGAAGLGDLGELFPDTDAAWAGADSTVLLAEVVRRLADDGWRVVNADCTVVLEQPRLAPHRLAMQARMGDAVGAPVSVKATRPEALGALGRGEGIACLAVAMVTRR